MKIKILSAIAVILFVCYIISLPTPKRQRYTTTIAIQYEDTTRDTLIDCYIGKKSKDIKLGSYGGLYRGYGSNNLLATGLRSFSILEIKIDSL